MRNAGIWKPITQAVIFGFAFTSVVLPNASAAEGASQLPSEQQVLTFIGDTIDWYRQLPTYQRITPEPADGILSREQAARGVRRRNGATDVEHPRHSPARRLRDYGKDLASIGSVAEGTFY